MSIKIPDHLTDRIRELVKDRAKQFADGGVVDRGGNALIYTALEFSQTKDEFNLFHSHCTGMCQYVFPEWLKDEDEYKREVKNEQLQNAGTRSSKLSWEPIEGRNPE